MLSVIKRCPECGKPFVKKSGAAKLCRDCAKKRQLEQIKKAAEQREDPEARRAYQAAYYVKNKERIMAQRKKKQKENKKAVSDSDTAFRLPLHIIRYFGVGPPPDLGEAVHADVEQRRRL